MRLNLRQQAACLFGYRSQARQLFYCEPFDESCFAQFDATLTGSSVASCTTKLIARVKNLAAITGR